MSKKAQNSVRLKEEKEEETEKKVVVGVDKKKVKEELVKRINEADSKLKVIVGLDKELRKKDSVQGTIDILESLKEGLEGLNQVDFEAKMQHYYLCYNTTIYMYDICRRLRQSEYGHQCIYYLAFAIVSLESYLVLQEPKYLEWRVKLYIQLAQLYDEDGQAAASVRTIENLKEKIQQQKSHKESTGQSQLLDYVQKSYSLNLLLLGTLEVKYRMRANQLASTDLLKKKLEELFTCNRDKVLALVEGLRNY